MAISITAASYDRNLNVPVTIRTLNDGDSALEVPMISKSLRLVAVDDSGKPHEVRRYCLYWYPIDRASTSLAPHAHRLELAEIDLQCTELQPGHYSLTAFAGSLRSNEVALVVLSEDAPRLYSECSMPPKVLRTAAVEFPKSSRQSNASRTVSVEVLLDADGSVASAWVHNSSGDEAMDAAALSTARASTYAPASSDCVPLFLWRFGF